MRLLPRAVLLLATLLGVLLCPAARAQEDEPDPAPAEVHRVDPPDSRVGRELAWVLRVINGDAPLGDPAAKFSPRFIEVFGVGDITEALTTMRAGVFRDNPVDLVEVYEEGDAEALNGIINGRETNLFLSVFIVLDEASGLIAGLQFNQAGYSCAAGDWDSYAGEFGRLRGSVSFGCYELVPEAPRDPADGGGGEGAILPNRLVNVYEIRERDPLHVSGAARLWTLASLARRVHDPAFSLDQPVTLRAEWMSVPGSPTREQGPGAVLPLRELATRAFAGNDSTALDHVLHTLGRDAVADVVREVCKDLGPSFPVLSTREYLALKLAPDADELTRYAENDPLVRAELLRDLKAEPDWNALGAWEKPAETERVGWIASVEDQCRLMAAIHDAERRPGGESLAPLWRNPGDVPLDEQTWTDVRAVAGREPGVLSFAWLLRRSDDRWYVMALTWVDAEGGTDEGRLLDLARAGIRILEAHGVQKPDQPADQPADAPAQPQPGT
ncbi:MAG: serine hydrolase [Planctomycetota bacterium]|nr:serine hydrolase [Planctomycetota bacterium]